MKRTAIKRRRAKPRPLDDTRLYEEYRERFHYDEVLYWTGAYFDENGRRTIEPIRCMREGQERHHIWSVSGQREHHWSNICTVSAGFHHRGHDWNPVQLRILSLFVKAHKRTTWGEMRECDLAELWRIGGQSVSAWVEYAKVVNDPWLEEKRLELLEMFAAFLD